jgi:hypothetical protein
MAHPMFYRVKAAGLAWELAQQRAARILAEARAAFMREMEACDLDPLATYRLEDERQQVVPVNEPEPCVSASLSSSH